MMEIDGESVFEDVIVKLIQAQSEQEQKLRSLREFNLQWTHGVALFFLDIAKRKVEIEVTMVSEDLDLAYKDAIEEAMVRSIIEASFHGLKDDIIETDPSSKLIRPRPVSEADEQALNVVLFDEMDEDNIKCLIFFQHRPSAWKVYPPIATVWRNKVIEPFEMHFSTPLDLQQLLGLMFTMSVILFWDCTMVE